MMQQKKKKKSNITGEQLKVNRGYLSAAKRCYFDPLGGSNMSHLGFFFVVMTTSGEESNKPKQAIQIINLTSFSTF